ncbi:MAG: protoheme IX farnesyltransferase [Chitinophagales bacterium]|nr:protoheme IX farnesyltransferase [Chitinophagales bacterium]
MSSQSTTYQLSYGLKSKLRDYAMLFKIRLSVVVVFSALAGYMLAADSISGVHLILLSIGGLLVTGASNTINQIIEKDTDKLMKRTQDRPIAANRMNVAEAIIVAGISSVSGLLILLLCFNPITSSLAAVALISYAFIYTPLKKITPIAVFIGAIPGALPPLLGYVSVTGQIDSFTIWLFLIQFIWQFPHFWAIAWVAYEDYKRAGIFLLPEKKQDSKYNAFLCVVYVLMIIPLILVAFMQSQMGLVAAIIAIAFTMLFLLPAIELYRKRTVAVAKKLMFASFIYLPMILILLVIDKM